MRKSLCLLLVAALAAFATPAFAQSELTGQTSGGAYYRVLVPPGWQPADGLAIWNHGFSLSPIGPLDDNDMGPLAPVQLAEGYAVAASSYSLTGWALFETAGDLEEMVQAFEAAFGVPDQVFLYGASLGGIVTAQALESADLGNVVGAYPICGALAGSPVWNGAFDLRQLYDALCGDVPGAAIPGGATGLPFPPDPGFDQTAMGIAVNACTGVSLPASARTPEQQARLDALLAVTRLPENFLLTDMGFATFGIFDLIFDPRKLAGGQGLGNEDVDYGDPAINQSVRRTEADPAARRRLLDNFTPTGRVGDVKIVSLHTDKDGLVIVENETAYAAVVPPENLTLGIVVEQVPSHCNFTPAEVLAGWESLRGWVAGLPQPSAAGLQAACEGIANGNLAPGPCRIDPGFVLPPFDGRVRPRDECTPGGQVLCLDGGRFKVEVDWETRGGLTGPGRVIPHADRSANFWFFNPAIIDLSVKIIDGRAVNGHFWFFYGSLTNVEFELTVTDTETGLEKIYQNPQGNFASRGDTSAF